MDAKKDKNLPDTGGDADALEKPQEVNDALESLSNDGDGGDGGVHAAPGEAPTASDKKKKPAGPLKKLWHRMNVYFLIFLLLLVVTAIIFIVSYLNSQKEPKLPEAALQDLTQEDLKEIAAGNATVGDPRYTLNIQSNAVFAGNALVRGDLNVAGNIQLGQRLLVPDLTVSGTSNLNTVQANTLSVANNLTVTGAVSLTNTLSVRGRLNAETDLSVNRSLNVGGTITAAQITTGSLTLAGNGNLNLNNHIRATGPTPSRSQGGAVGAGGTTSLSGSDIAGTLNVNTGNSPAPGCFATINFVQAFSGTPKVIVTPIGAAAGQTQFYVNRGSNSFSICTANSAPAGQTFAFDYFVVN